MATPIPAETVPEFTPRPWTLPEGHRGELAGLGWGKAKGYDDRAEQKRQERHVDLVDEPGGGDNREDLTLVA